MSRSVLFALFAVLVLAGPPAAQAQPEPEPSARNPILWTDVPDPSVIRVGDTYYMSSTTMHMSPGVPLMKSQNLVDWQLAGYAYDTLVDNDDLAMRGGRDAYGRGSWASSLRHHDGMYYLATFSYTTGQTHIYRTADLENGPWTEAIINHLYHDPSLLFDDDGRVYLIHGRGDIRIVELTADATAVKEGGLDEVLIPNSSQVAGDDIMLPAEGAHVHKVDGTYYVFLITWPRGGMRTQLVYRSDNVSGPYEGRVALQDQGVAQGGLVSTPAGDWYALLFGDRGAVGRIPYLVPVRWEDGWPVFGIGEDAGEGAGGKVPERLEIPSSRAGTAGLTASDDFDYASPDSLAPVWQWNHNPDGRFWSVNERPGHLRLTNGRTDAGFTATRNTLTQRTFGPQSAATVTLDASGLEPGDYAGLGLLQENFGFVGVQATADGASVAMMNGSRDGPPRVVETVPLRRGPVHLAAQTDYHDQVDEATFYYRFDDEAVWTPIGDTLAMSYTLSHFMGYRFALFNYATETPGGYADFDDFEIGETL